MMVNGGKYKKHVVLICVQAINIISTNNTHMNDFSYKKLYQKILCDCTVNVKGVHGVSHWVRVLKNGIYISEKEHLPNKVIMCFALLHDSQRLNDDEDPMHGRRAAEYALKIRKSYLNMSDEEFEQLQFACVYHTHSENTEDKVIHACWDSDRLDLGRVGITPDPCYLNTLTARYIAEHELFHLLEDFKPDKGLLI